MSKPSFLFIPPEVGYSGRQTSHKRRKNLIFTGIFVSLMLLILMITVYFFSGGVKKSYLLTTHFINIAGLDKDSNVSQSGYSIGKIENIDFISSIDQRQHCLPIKPTDKKCSVTIKPATSCFKITLRIKQGWKIPNNSFAMIGSGGLLSGNEIKIQSGHSAQHFAEHGLIPSCGAEPDLMSQLTVLSDETTFLIKSLNLVLTTDAQQGEKKIAGILSNLREISQTLTIASQALEAEKITSILDSANLSSKNIAKSSENLVKVTAVAHQRIKDLHGVIDEHKNLALDIRALLKENQPAIKGSLSETQQITREIARHLTPILNNLDQASRNIKELTRDIQENPAVIFSGKETLTDIAP